jgi:hypothetical protein
MTLKTLADVRELMRHLPPDHRNRSTWRVVADDLQAAARGADPAEVAVALRLALMFGIRRVPAGKMKGSAAAEVGGAQSYGVRSQQQLDRGCTGSG